MKRRAIPMAASAVLAWLAASCSGTMDREAETDRLLAMHESVLEAHRTGDVEAWMALEADPYVVANRGEITFPDATARREVRERYLGSTTFAQYRDLRPPIVRLSDDGTLGWLMAEVEVRGTQRAEGTETPVEAIWAWIELYERRAGEWRMIGNLSNQRPDDS